MQYTFHIVGLPHTQTTAEYNCCAYTQKVIKFCKMMKDLGHKVFLYGSSENEAVCDEFIPCYYKRWSPAEYLDAPFDPQADHWVRMNHIAWAEITIRAKDKDFLCLIAGRCQQVLAEKLPYLMAVEFGVGYAGVFAKFKVFESYAWMHTVYGQMAGSADRADGNFYDRVIPNFFDHTQYHVSKKKGDYFLYMGRLTDRKGWRIAQQACEKIRARLIVAGPGQFDGYGEYVGMVSGEQKANLLADAVAVLCPSIYIEPFCGVMAEALLSGTPVIATPWGTFSENIKTGVDGYTCHSFKDFIQAMHWCENGMLKPGEKIRNRAIDRFSMLELAYHYDHYFDHLYTLWDKGWYA